MAKETPKPIVGYGRQFFAPDGGEIFFSEAYGRRPDRPDALRVMGWGKNREEAKKNAEANWKAAWRSLESKRRVAAEA